MEENMEEYMRLYDPLLPGIEQDTSVGKGITGSLYYLKMREQMRTNPERGPWIWVEQSENKESE